MNFAGRRVRADRRIAASRAGWAHRGQVVEKGAKTDAGGRTLPLPSPVTAVLRRLSTAQATERLAAGAAYTASGYVLVDELGQPYKTQGGQRVGPVSAIDDLADFLLARAHEPSVRPADRQTTEGLVQAWRAGLNPWDDRGRAAHGWHRLCRPRRLPTGVASCRAARRSVRFRAICTR